MKFYSTRGQAEEVSLKDALFTGLAPDAGLFMPESLPKFSQDEITAMSSMSFQEIAFKIAKEFVGDEVAEEVLQKIIDQAFTFDAPFYELNEDTSILELWHGPTLAFKDFGARFMAGLMSYFAKQDGRKLTILTATSGDTGGAVASAFHNKENIEVVILFPKDKVSPLQEKQITTLGGNVTAIEIDATFDDCQRLVKDSFKDVELVKRLRLTSANSINIGRLIPQSFYYFYSFSRLQRTDLPLVYVIPSGNFGNLTAGLFAKEMGMPIDRFIAATNMNDVIPEYLETGEYKPRSSVETISNAMDIGAPSNFERIRHMYDDDLDKIANVMWGASVSEEETKETLYSIFESGYLMDPHTAVALKALQKYPSKVQAVVLSTAYPAKFKDVVEDIIGQEIEVPAGLQFAEDLQIHKKMMNAEEFQSWFSQA